MACVPEFYSARKKCHCHSRQLCKMKLISARFFAMKDRLFSHGTIFFCCCCCWKNHSNSPFQAVVKNDSTDFMCGGEEGGQSHCAQLHGTLRSSPTCLWRRVPKILTVLGTPPFSLIRRKPVNAQLCSWQDTCIYLWSKILESPNWLHIKLPHSTLSYQEKWYKNFHLSRGSSWLMLYLRDEIDVICLCLELLRHSCYIICV